MEKLAGEQRVAAARPGESQTFVLGGPGTGKTYTLAERVKALLDGEDTAAADALLVMSFTRAAVAELRRRLAGHPVARLIRPTTIDAYARTVLKRHGFPPDAGDFDRTILSAARCLADPTGAEEYHPGHVIVDEAQDLAEPRLTFVRELLTRAGGFTVFGDPAQGIYGFRSREYRNPIAALRHDFPAAELVTLTIDHRVRRSAAAPAAAARSELLDGDASRARRRLRAELSQIPRVTEEQLAVVLRHADARSAVACRTGGDVLVISQGLRERGVNHRIQPGADAPIPPMWIAVTLARADGELLTREEFNALTEFEDPAVNDAAWSSLERVGGVGDHGVRLDLVRDRISAVGAGEVPDPAEALPVVSTIHRIKGLEFARVFVVEPFDPREQEDDGEEARVLYVAMTRARDDTLMLVRPKTGYAVRKRGDRWIATPWRSDRLLRIEFRVGDVDRGSPFTEEGSAAFIQRHLRTRVALGDPVMLERTTRYGNTTYQVLHKGLSIATVSDTLVDALDRLGAAPGTIADVYVAAVSSTAGHPEATSAAEIGWGGFWLVPELAGFGRLL